MGELQELINSISTMNCIDDVDPKLKLLFRAIKQASNKNCTSSEKKILFASIELEYLQNILSNNSVATDTMSKIPKMVAAIALGILCFDSDVPKDPKMLSLVPELLEIVCKNDNSSHIAKNTAEGAYTCLLTFLRHADGQKALVDQKGIEKLSEAYLSGNAHPHRSLIILQSLISNKIGSWTEESATLFHNLLNKMALNFETNDETEEKLKICALMTLFLTYTSGNVIKLRWQSNSWPRSVSRAVRDILNSYGSGTNEVLHALSLAFILTKTFGIDWALVLPDQPFEFLELVVASALDEIENLLQPKKFDAIMANVDFLTRCITIVQIFMTETRGYKPKFSRNGHWGLMDQIDKTLWLIFDLLAPVSTWNFTEIKKPADRKCIYLMVKTVALRLTNNRSTLRSQANKILPVLLNLANDSFYAQRSYGLSGNIQKNEGNESATVENIDILPEIIPLLGVLVDHGQFTHILLRERQDEVLVDYFKYHWFIITAPKPPDGEGFGDLEKRDESRCVLDDICTIFISLVIRHSKHSMKVPLTLRVVSQFIIDNLPKMERSRENLELAGVMVLLEIQLLVLIRGIVDERLIEFMKAMIQLLHDTYDLTPNEENKMVITGFGSVGIEILPKFVKNVWFANYGIDLACVESIVGLLKKVTSIEIRSKIRDGYEAFFLSLINACPRILPDLREYGLLKVSQDHLMFKLTQVLKV